MVLKLPRIRWPTGHQIDDWIREACLLAGFGVLVWGIHLIYHPAAWIIGGILLLYAGWPAGKRRGG